MPANKVIDLLLVLLVQVLELVGRRKLLDVQAVRQHTIGLPLQQMLALECRDMRHRRENIRRVSSSPFDAISVIDSSLARLCINVEKLQVVVEVNRTGTEVPAKQCGVSREDGGN